MWREAWADPYSRTVIKMSGFTVVQAVVMIVYAVTV